MEVLIPVPADCEVRSVIKFMTAQSTAPIAIQHTGHVFGEFRLQIPVLTRLIGVIFVVSLSHLKKGSNPKRKTSTTQGYRSFTHGTANCSIPGVNKLKNR